MHAYTYIHMHMHILYDVRDCKKSTHSIVCLLHTALTIELLLCLGLIHNLWHGIDFLNIIPTNTTCIRTLNYVGAPQMMWTRSTFITTLQASLSCSQPSSQLPTHSCSQPACHPSSSPPIHVASHPSSYPPIHVASNPSSYPPIHVASHLAIHPFM